MPQLTRPSKPQPKYRKTLNHDQRVTLALLYKFRFSTGEQIANYSGKPHAKFVQKRLQILEDQELIAKRYDKSYKLRGKPATYYLLPAGARALARLTRRDADEPINLQTIYKDRDVSENFISHCTNIMSAYLVFRSHYGDQLEFFTKSDLRYDHYDYYPQPLPDAYITLETTNGPRQFFLDIFEDTTPYFVLLRRVKKYFSYAEEGDWAIEDSPLPTILLVCESPSTQKRLRKRITKVLIESYETVNFATTIASQLLEITQVSPRIWTPVDEYGDDPDEPVVPQSLNGIILTAPNTSHPQEKA